MTTDAVDMATLMDLDPDELQHSHWTCREAGQAAGYPANLRMGLLEISRILVITWPATFSQV